MDPSRVLSRALLRLYPADVRRRTGDDLEAAFAYCVARERHGPPGVAYAWAQLVVDAIATSVQMRRDARRARRIGRQPRLITTRKEGIMSRLSRDPGRLMLFSKSIPAILWPSGGRRRLWALSRSRRALSPRGEPLAWSRSQRFAASDQSRELDVHSVLRRTHVQCRPEC